MPPAETEPAIPATKRLQTYALERTATWIYVYAGHYIIFRLHTVACDTVVESRVTHSVYEERRNVFYCYY
jgi:hypothetical protein